MTSRNLPPGPSKSSLIQALQLARTPYAVLADNQARYGDLFAMRIWGWGDFVVASDPDDIKKIFTAPPAVLSAGRARWMLDPVFGRKSLLTRDGSEHAWQRRFLMPYFHRENLKKGQQIAIDATYDAMSRWPARADISMAGDLASITTDVLIKKFLGFDQPEESESVKTVLLDFLKESRQAAVFNIPALINMNVGPWRRYHKARRRMDELLYKEIAERRERPRPVENDIITALHQAEKNDGEPLSDSVVRDIVVMLLGSGQETVAYTLAWVLEAILSHREVVDRIRGEIDRATAGDRLAVPHLEQLPYLHAAVTEAMRLYPINPIIPRLVLQPGFTVGGYELPVGTHVAGNSYGAQRRAATYSDPLAFRPERFLGDARPDIYTWLPFGGGARKCIAATYVMYEVPAIVATLLTHPDLRLRADRVQPGVSARDMVAPAGGTVVSTAPARPR
ncbi:MULTISPECIES: cytochrome P450 [unclassified Streptomyces]|uniref:Cytochrome P450 n=1 Tax=Streptomyces sp. NBC_00060 TaxID=2975636 RepID=A0AAU2HCI6_9ACTN